jgi:hypothetical protein
MSEALTSIEAGTLQAYEKAIERGLASFVEVGRALTQIRDGRLYRATHGTFEDYCQERWQMSRQRASQVIEASGVADRVKKNLPDAPAIGKASHAEELAELPEEEQAEAWQEAVETAPDGRVTAEHVAEVVEKRKPPTPSAPKPNVATIWREIEKHIDAASNLFTAHARDCDEAFDVKRLLEDAAEKFGYYVRNVEAV